MWVNPLYSSHDIDLALEIMERHPLATLIVGEPLLVSHMPVIVTRNGTELTAEGHIPRSDPLCEHLMAGREAVIVFAGPSSYVSPSWYLNPGLPTYNYIPIHLKGRAEAMSGEEELRSHLAQLMDLHERTARWDLNGDAAESLPGTDRAKWAPDDAAHQRTDKLIGAIRGFRMPIQQLEIKTKLGQNRRPEEVAHTAGILMQSSDPDDQFIAAHMTRNSPHSNR